MFLWQLTESNSFQVLWLDLFFGRTDLFAVNHWLDQSCLLVCITDLTWNLFCDMLVICDMQLTFYNLKIRYELDFLSKGSIALHLSYFTLFLLIFAVIGCLCVCVLGWLDFTLSKSVCLLFSFIPLTRHLSCITVLLFFNYVRHAIVCFRECVIKWNKVYAYIYL